jgi:branched-chain amino acid aminotransferase
MRTEVAMAEMTYYHNGEWVPENQVMIHPFDRGFTMGDVVFDVERTFDGKIFRLKEHIDRLYRSLQYYRIDPEMSMHEMADVSEEAVRRNEDLRPPGGDVSVRQTVTRGRPGGAFQGSPLDHMTPTVIISVDPLVWSHASQYETGAAVVFPSVRSYSSSSLDPKAKHYSRGNFVQAQIQAADVDPHAHPVLLDQNGNISEGVTNNFFMVTDGVIRTPSDNAILQGISRMTVFDLANQLNIPIVEEDLQPYDAYTSDEAFLTNSLFQLLPLATIDKRHVGDEVPGPISKQLLAAWSELVGLDIVGQALEQAKG